MWNFIDQLRTKSPAVRRRYAFGISGSIVGIIAIVWFVSFMNTLSKEKVNMVSNEPTPLEAISENFSDGLDDVKNTIGETQPFSSSASSSTSYGEVIITDPGQ
ncbi:MAG: hypothetical protein K0S38_728 [Candidatus Paceibacter sp.]|jgi:hypothetical protein|nr:hypothetical protein [Candidatus Paceibacter sp.]